MGGVAGKYHTRCYLHVTNLMMISPCALKRQSKSQRTQGSRSFLICLLTSRHYGYFQARGNAWILQHKFMEEQELGKQTF